MTWPGNPCASHEHSTPSNTMPRGTRCTHVRRFTSSNVVRQFGAEKHSESALTDRPVARPRRRCNGQTVSLLSKVSLTAIVFMALYTVRPLLLDSLARVYASRPAWVFYAGGSLCERTTLRDADQPVYDCLMQDGRQRCLVRQGKTARDVTTVVRSRERRSASAPLCSFGDPAGLGP